MNKDVLVGRFDTTIDSRGRIKLPEEWGFALGPGRLMYVVPSKDGRSLSLMPAQHWDEALVGLRERALFDPKACAALKKIGKESRMYTAKSERKRNFEAGGVSFLRSNNLLTGRSSRCSRAYPCKWKSRFCHLHGCA